MGIFNIVLACIISAVLLVCIVLQIRVWIKKRAEKRRKMAKKISTEDKSNE